MLTLRYRVVYVTAPPSREANIIDQDSEGRPLDHHNAALIVGALRGAGIDAREQVAAEWQDVVYDDNGEAHLTNELTLVDALWSPADA